MSVAALIAAAYLADDDGAPAGTTVDAAPTFAASTTTTATTTIPPVVRSEFAPAAGLTTEDALLSSRRPDARDEPGRVSVASVGIDAAVTPVGLDERGAMAVPLADAGWYRFGAGPGEAGSTVIAAHVNFAGRVGPFSTLGSVEPGAEIVVTAAGHARRYVVTERRVLAKDDLPGSGLFVTDGPERLVLITCGGNLDVAKHSYVDNVVVTAVPA